jgi:diaminopimelate epimerase
MSGAGNLFTVADNRKAKLDKNRWSSLAPIVCDENEYNDFATEGLLVIDSSEKGDFTAMFFNPDGSSEMMCGNGGRCAVMFAAREGFLDGDSGGVAFYMAGSKYHSEIIGDKVRLRLPAPVKVDTSVSLHLAEDDISAGFVDVNSEHLVVNACRLAGISQEVFFSADLKSVFLELRHLQKFNPPGININIFLPVSENQIYLRTFERGVEAETGACGTGAISTAIISAAAGLTDLPTTVVPPSRIPLRVYIDGSIKNGINEVILEGPAETLRSATIEINDEL